MVTAKAALLLSALCTCASVGNAFLPTGCAPVSRIPGTPSLNGRYTASSSLLRLGAAASTQSAISARSAEIYNSRAARTSLFSSPPPAESDAAAAVVKSVEEVAEKATGDKKKKGPVQVAAYFGLWYLFNIGYNIYNKRVLNIYPLPWIIATAQMGIGLLYVFPLWMSKLRKAPKLAKGALGPLSQLAALHTIAHATAVLSLGAGAVSFTHIVKAGEPVFTAGFSAAILGQTFALPVYISLLPIIAGVSLASLKELSFSWVAFGNAMGSNTASALRGIMGKKQMGKPVGENMSAANLYAVLTVLAFCMLTPVALLVEGTKIKSAWEAAIAAGATAKGLSKSILLSGLFYYLYNEVAFLALDSVNPVTHAVGNTIKRVVIIVAACLAFRTPMTPLAIVGSTMAVGGTLVYSLVKAKYEKK